MKVVVAVCLAVAVGFAHGGLLASHGLVRTPSLDTAIVRSDRIGGNFAYSTIEGHAYAVLAPVIQSVVAAPVGFAGFAHYPHISSVIAAQPIISSPGIIAQAPVITAPIADAPAPVAIAESPSSVVVDEDTVAIESA